MASTSRLILATGCRELDEYYLDLARESKMTVAAQVFYREAVIDAIRKNPADILLLSAYLPGGMDLADVVFEARMANLRVVFLAGDTPRQSQLVKDLIAMGVYDILFYDDRERAVDISDIDSCIVRPRTFQEALRAARQSAKPAPSRDFFAIFRAWERALARRLAKEEPDAEKDSGPLPAAAPDKADRPESAEEPLEDEGPGFEPIRPVVAVWSPGGEDGAETALSLAQALAGRGKSVALADLDVDRCPIHEALGLPPGEDFLSDVLSPSLLLLDGPFGKEVQGVTVLSRSKNANAGGHGPNRSDIARFLSSPKIGCDILVCNLPPHLSGWARELLRSASAVVVTGSVQPEPLQRTKVFVLKGGESADIDELAEQVLRVCKASQPLALPGLPADSPPARSRRRRA